MKDTAILLISCPTQKGITAAVSDFIFRSNGNIVRVDEHLDVEHNVQLLRVEWDLDGFSVDMRSFARHFEPVADRFQMRWRTEVSSYRPKVAIFVSRYDHCLADLLYRQRLGDSGSWPQSAPRRVRRPAGTRGESAPRESRSALREQNRRLPVTSGVMARVTVRVGKDIIESVITERSAEEMKLKVGDTVKAVIKSAEGMLEKDAFLLARIQMRRQRCRARSRIKGRSRLWRSR